MSTESFLNVGAVLSTVAEMKRTIVPSDFGVPAKYNEEAQRFADYLMAGGREVERATLTRWLGLIERGDEDVVAREMRGILAAEAKR